MNRTISQTENWNGLELAYSFELENNGVSQVAVTGHKEADGASLRISRHYWRDMSYAPTASASMLSEEENGHIADEVQRIWDSYPDVIIPEVEEINEEEEK